MRSDKQTTATSVMRSRISSSQLIGKLHAYHQTIEPIQKRMADIYARQVPAIILTGGKIERTYNFSDPELQMIELLKLQIEAVRRSIFGDTGPTL